MLKSTNIVMQLYFVAIQLPSPIDSEIRVLQQEMAEQFQSSRQLKIPVHITLIPPFRFENEKAVLEAFEKASSDLSFSSEIVLSGFNQFRQKVLFVAVKENDKLSLIRSHIYRTVSRMLSLEWPPHTDNFHPHVTIANRDLTHDSFKNAWPTFKDRPYSRKFDKIEIVLYKHIEGIWHVRSSKIISK